MLYAWHVTFFYNGRHDVINPTAHHMTEAVEKAVAISIKRGAIPIGTMPDTVLNGMSPVTLWGAGITQEVHE